MSADLLDFFMALSANRRVLLVIYNAQAQQDYA